MRTKRSLFIVRFVSTTGGHEENANESTYIYQEEQVVESHNQNAPN